jgi:hypothetical protein
MYVVMYNSTRTEEGLMYIVMYYSTQSLEGLYVHCNVQQYTDSIIVVLIRSILCSQFNILFFVIVITLYVFLRVRNILTSGTAIIVSGRIFLYGVCLLVMGF